MTKLIKKLSVNSNEALVIHGVNIRAMFEQKVDTGIIYRNVGHFAWKLKNGGQRDSLGRFVSIKKVNEKLAS